MRCYIDRRDGPRTRAQRFHDDRGDEVPSSSQSSFQGSFTFTFVFGNARLKKNIRVQKAYRSRCRCSE